ncbi:MAG: hypothetical protein IKW39_05960 [Alphaproteobacteria bacterium]|nr:hypothetical protein [Alphaproteobacteria bacterium]
MKKLKNASEEQRFLREGNNSDVLCYILSYALKYSSEEVFVELYPDLVPCYIEKYGLGQKAGSNVILSGNWRNIKDLLESDNLRYSPEALFLEHGDYKQVVGWLKDNDCSKYLEKDLFWSDDVGKIVDYIRKHKISDFGQRDLIMRKVSDVQKALILYDKLNANNRILFVKVASAEIAWMLVTLSERRKDYNLLRQIYEVRFLKNKKKLVKKRLFKEAEDLFIKTAPLDDVVTYANNCGLNNIVDRLLDRPKEDGFIKLLSKTQLSLEGEQKLFDRGCHVEIKAYIKTHVLSDDTEVKLIKRGNHHEIMLYLKKHSLSDVAQLELIKRGKSIEIIEFVSNYPLADVAYYALIKRGIKDEIDAINTFSFSE